MNNQIEYEKRICFFIDILGFKDIVTGEVHKTPDKIKEFLSLFKNHQTLYHDEELKFSTKKVTAFSDSIVISFNYIESDEIFLTLYSIQDLQAELAVSHNVFLRGGCAIGELYHDEDFVFGEALIEAYQLESKKASVPRIIIPENVIKECAKYSKIQNKEENIKKELLDKDIDEYYFIDYISHLQPKRKQMSYYANEEGFIDYMEELRKKIQENLNYKDVSVHSKYLWLKEKYNKAIKFFEGYSEGREIE